MLNDPIFEVVSDNFNAIFFFATDIYTRYDLFGQRVFRILKITGVYTVACVRLNFPSYPRNFVVFDFLLLTICFRNQQHNFVQKFSYTRKQLIIFIRCTLWYIRNRSDDSDEHDTNCTFLEDEYILCSLTRLFPSGKHCIYRLAHTIFVIYVIVIITFVVIKR